MEHIEQHIQKYICEGFSYTSKLGLQGQGVSKNIVEFVKNAIWY